MASAFSSIPDDRAAKVIEVPDIRGCMVLVLGAGASAPYGFPTGKQLVDDICQQFPDAFERLDAYGSAPQERKAKAVDFVEKLQDSACVSIDEFLANHATNAEVVLLGKIAIANALLPKEDEERLRRTKDWYQLLIDWWWKKRKTLVVITFNYDRSFEQAFYSALLGRGLSPQDAQVIMVRPQFQQLGVEHVHGQFGHLPFEDLPGDAVPYGLTPDEDPGPKVIRAARAPKLMFEHTADTGAANALVRASRVLFLGFGYDQTNLRRIIPTWNGEVLQPGTTIEGTGYGLTPKKLREVEALLLQWAGHHWQGPPKIVPKTALEAMRETNWFEQ